MKKILSFGLASFFFLSPVEATRLIWDERNEDATMTKVFVGGEMLENLSSNNLMTVSNYTKDDFSFLPYFKNGG